MSCTLASRKMQNKLVLGLIGRIGSGKTAVADYLVKTHDAKYLRFSDVLKDILARVHKENTRENLQNLGAALRGIFGDGILAEVLRQDILDSEKRVVVVDGIRYADEVDMVKSLGGKVIYVKAPDKMRYERTVRRATRGEAKLTFEQFKKSEVKGTERFIDVLGEQADYAIENSGTLEDLRKKAEEIVKDAGLR